MVFIATVTIFKYRYGHKIVLPVNGKTKVNEVYQSFLPKSKLLRSSYRISLGILIKNTTKFQLPKTCSKRYSLKWKICDAVRCIPHNTAIEWTYPRITNRGEKTGDFINRILEIAWGSNPPSVDLYLRSGCHGFMEMKYLFESIELFWPRFLGSVVVVLDAGDQFIPNHLLAKNPTHHYVIGFEHLACLSGCVFNQKQI